MSWEISFHICISVSVFNGMCLRSRDTYEEVLGPVPLPPVERR